MYIQTTTNKMEHTTESWRNISTEVPGEHNSKGDFNWFESLTTTATGGARRGGVRRGGGKPQPKGKVNIIKPIFITLPRYNLVPC